MYIFFTSIRTANIYGPAQVEHIHNPDSTLIEFSGHWFGPEKLDEWEGYVVCVPEQKRVWGKAFPEITDDRINVRMVFNPQNLPDKDLKIFDKLPHQKIIEEKIEE